MADQSASQQQPTNDDVKRMYRSDKDRVLAGVCGGMAEYFHIDPLVVRLCWVVVSIVTGAFPGLIAYVVAAVVIPARPTGSGTGAAQPGSDTPETPKQDA